jgi:hypothetical protein
MRVRVGQEREDHLLDLIGIFVVFVGRRASRLLH